MATALNTPAVGGAFLIQEQSPRDVFTPAVYARLEESYRGVLERTTGSAYLKKHDIHGGGLVPENAEEFAPLLSRQWHDMIARIFEIKQRPTFDPLIVHVADAEMLNGVAASLPVAARAAIDAALARAAVRS